MALDAAGSDAARQTLNRVNGGAERQVIDLLPCVDGRNLMDTEKLMNKLATLALGALAFAMTTPVLAQDAPPKAPKPPKEKKICHTEIAIGSIMPKSVCHTKAEWAQIDGANSDNARQALEQPRTPEIQRP